MDEAQADSAVAQFRSAFPDEAFTQSMFFGMRSDATDAERGFASVHTRLGPADLATVDAVIAAGIASSRAEVVRWAIGRIREDPPIGLSPTGELRTQFGGVRSVSVFQQHAQGLLELLGLGGGERAEEIPLGLLDCLGGLPDGGAAGVCQLDHVLAPVIWVLAALDQALELKLVDQRDHRRAVDVHRAGDLALRHRAVWVDGPEHRSLPAVDPERRERDRAELEEPQLRVLEQISQVRVLTMAGHVAKSTNKLIVSDTDDQTK